MVDMVSDLKRKVIALLDQVFPEYEKLFTNIFGVTSSELLRNCSTPEEILAIDTEQLIQMISEPSRKRFGKEKAEEIQTLAGNSFGILLNYDTMGILIKQHMEHIRFSELQIKELEGRIAFLFLAFHLQQS